MLDNLAFMRALILWNYNVSARERFEAVYGPGRHESYIAEKVDRIQRDPLRWASTLDPEHQQRLVTVIMDRYGDEGNRWAEAILNG